MTHALKTWPEYYKQMELGVKTFELRKDDRPFERDDTVLLQEYNPDGGVFTGKELPFTITHILRDANFAGLKKGFCILSLKPKDSGY